MKKLDVQLIFEKEINIESDLTFIVSKLKECLNQENLYTDLNSNVLLLSGDLGAGKTTFVRYLCESYGIFTSQSPTYAIHQKYISNQIKNPIKDEIVIHHFDLYRIQEASELMSTGFWDLICQNDFLFLIEWYEKINDPEWIESLIQNKNIYGLKITILSESRLFQLFKIS